MIVVENIDVHGFEHAIRAARNPMNSWAKSDSNGDMIGTADMDLLKRLTKAGVPHRTFLRMIVVWMDITAPLYWWKEADRYTVGKAQVSTSTMHTIHKKEFTLDDFSHEKMSEGMRNVLLLSVIPQLNESRELYLYKRNKPAVWDYENKINWWDMIQMLPSSYNQKRTVMMSYEVCLKIIEERTGHRLDEWNSFVEILKRLPYMEQFTICLNDSKDS